jgi:hypothetical protein
MKNQVLAIILVTGFIFAATQAMNAQKAIVDEQLIGRWELCSPEGEIIKTPHVRQKIYTKNSYVVLEVNKENNTAAVDFIGTVVAESENKIVETPIYTHIMIKNMLLQNFSFLYKIDGDYLYLLGIDNQFKEIWVRVSE